MENTRIFEGKTSTEAIEKGLKELKVSKKDVEIKILENEEKRSFFNILTPRVVKVEITIKDKKVNTEQIVKKEKKEEVEVSKEDFEKAKIQLEQFLKEFVSKIDKEITYEIKEESKNTLSVELKSEVAKFLIGYRGEALNSLQTLLIAVAGKDIKEKIHVTVDILGYREKRKKVLENLAVRIASSVVRSRKPITLEPMTAYERKVIHTKLQEHNKVKTESIGEGSHRRVVISLK